MLWVCLLLAAASGVMALTARGFFPLIASHFPPEKLALSIRLFYALLPVVLITGIATNCTAVLNTFDRFALPALAPVATPVAIIAGSAAAERPLRNLGDGLRDARRRAGSCGSGGVDDGLAAAIAFASGGTERLKRREKWRGSMALCC